MNDEDGLGLHLHPGRDRVGILRERRPVVWLNRNNVVLLVGKGFGPVR